MAFADHHCRSHLTPAPTPGMRRLRIPPAFSTRSYRRPSGPAHTASFCAHRRRRHLLPALTGGLCCTLSPPVLTGDLQRPLSLAALFAHLYRLQSPVALISYFYGLLLTPFLPMFIICLYGEKLVSLPDSIGFPHHLHYSSTLACCPQRPSSPAAFTTNPHQLASPPT